MTYRSPLSDLMEIKEADPRTPWTTTRLASLFSQVWSSRLFGRRCTDASLEDAACRGSC